MGTLADRLGTPAALQVPVIDQAPDLGGRTVSTEPIRSVELAGAKVSLLFRYGDLDVLMSDIAVRSALADSSLGGGVSWHLVVEGRAVFEQGDVDWEVLPTHSLTLPGTEPYRIVNPGGEALRLLSVVIGAPPAAASAAA